jgi:hypothetical protein
MKLCMKLCAVAAAIVVALAGCTAQRQEEQKVSESKSAPDQSLAAKIRRFAPTEVAADPSGLSENDRKALDKIIEAAKLMDSLFLRQVWGGNEALKQRLEADTSTAGQERLHYFLINKGPWDRIDNKEPFIEGVPHEKPPQANFYPDGMTRDEFNNWAQSLSDDERR